MGLDMYLTCSSKTVTEAAWKGESVSPWYIVSGCACYWRKANQIHEWFVNNVQYGDDNCGIYDVSVEQLQDLLAAVNRVLDSTELVDGEVTNGYTLNANGFTKNVERGKVLADPSLAMELLPTTDGFFFGGTDYDQWYWEDLLYTRDHLTRILDSVERVEYRAFENDSEFKFSDWMAKGETGWEVRFQYHSSW